jgi:hypothetical protein
MGALITVGSLERSVHIVVTFAARRDVQRKQRSLGRRMSPLATRVASADAHVGTFIALKA